MRQYIKLFAVLFLLALPAKNNAETAVQTKPLLKVLFIDVGQGDSAFITTPEGITVLIDAGEGATSWSSFDAGKSIVVPLLKKLKVQSIDYILMSHPHNDHIGGLPAVLENFTVNTFIDPGFQYPSYVYENLLEIVENKKVKYIEARAGADIKLDKYCSLKVFNPPANEYFKGGSEPNENSLTVKLEFDKISFLFTGDIEKQAEKNIIRLFKNDIASTVLKVAHHGSNTSSSEQFLDWAQPLIAVVSVGAGNRFGHPKKEVLKRLNDYGCKTYRTDADGTVLIITDGKNYDVKLIKIQTKMDDGQKDEYDEETNYGEGYE